MTPPNPFNCFAALQHYGGPGPGNGSFFRDYFPTNSFEDAALDLGVPQSHGMTAVMIGYLSSIWAELKGIPLGFVIPLRVSGSGFASTLNTIAYPRVIGASLDLEIAPPEDNDKIFGEVPIYYLGMCGFGTAFGPGADFTIGPFSIGITAGPTSVQKGPPIYINHLNWRARPGYDNAVNMFWWHLKPGVSGVLNLATEADSQQGCIVISTTADGMTQAYNPMLNQPLIEGTHNLAGQPL